MTATSNIKQSDFDINDALDSIALSEENAYEEGYHEGIEAGKLAGASEGWSLGISLGSQLGVELGYYQSYCENLLEKKHYPTKVTKLCQKIVEAVNKFPRSNVDSEDILQSASQIRGQFKILKGFLSGKSGSVRKGNESTKDDELKQSFSF